LKRTPGIGRARVSLGWNPRFTFGRDLTFSIGPAYGSQQHEQEGKNGRRDPSAAAERG